MNAFVKKEIRLLLPNAAICCVLGLANFLFKFNNDGSLQYIWWSLLSFVFCGAMAVMLALNSFGAEISSGTFSNLLAQPVSRQKIWDTKILLLAVTLAVVGLFWTVCAVIRLTVLGRNPGFIDALTGVGLFGLVIFSGGLWTVLLLRQVAAAFWFTMLIPAMIAGGLGAFLGEYSSEFQAGMIVCALGIYSLAGLFFARWLFFRAQDLQWSGGTIVMPEMRGLTRFKSTGERRAWRPRAALWKKEFQLHQSQYVMAFVLLVLHLGVLVARKLGNFHKNSSTEFILEIFWGLWFVMPLLIGCTAMAEERKLGTLAGQLCLPSKQRTQFKVKFITMLCLSIFFGALIPLLLEGPRILPSAPKFFLDNAPPEWLAQLAWVQADAFFAISAFVRSLPLLMFIGIAAAIGMLSFYASSLARNTLQALAPAVMGCLLFFYSIVALASLRAFGLNYLWSGPLHFFVLLPLLFFALVWFSAQNFQQLAPDGKLWARNGVKVLLALALSIAMTTLVYHRFWEKLTPFEPSHGVARLSLENSARLDVQWGEVSAYLSGGKLWRASYEPDPGNNLPLANLLQNYMYRLDDGGFVDGTNWSMVRRTANEWVGIKNDGTLWASEEPEKVHKNKQGWLVADEAKVKHLVRVGTETNWHSVLPFGYFSFLVKNDGTLWDWGSVTNNYAAWRTNWPGLRSFTPERVGTESNWAGVCYDNPWTCLYKMDGSVWARFTPQFTNGEKMIEIRPGFTFTCIGNFGLETFRNTATVMLGKHFRVGVRNDGTFRVWSEQRLENISRSKVGYVWEPVDYQIGEDTNWLAVTGSGDKIVTLKNDGSLWLWNFHYDYWRYDYRHNITGHDLTRVKPARLGTHSDWVAISGPFGNVTSLAADGSLWRWPLQAANPNEFYDNGTPQIAPLIDFSRKPQLLGNVFAATP